MTAIAHAFVKAGMSADLGRLAVAVENLMTRDGVQPMKALARFVEALQSDQALLRALAADCIMRYDAEYKNKSLIDDDPKPHAVCQAPVVVGRSVGSDVGQGRCETSAKSLPASLPLQAEREAQTSCASAAIPAASRSAPVHDRRGQMALANQPKYVAPVVKPNPPRGPAAIASVQHVVARSVFDTFRVRDGRAIGNVPWGDLIKLARTNEWEARVLRFIEGQGKPVDPKTLVRNAVSAKAVEDAVRFALEAENAVA